MISLKAVSKSYPGGLVAVDELSLDVEDGELCVLVGPSGCGKTTTLKMVNRLVEPSSGEIFIDNENVLRLDPVQLRRRIGYVMQQGGLFPHQRVAANVGVVPRLLGWSKPRIRDRVAELLELVGLDPSEYGRRYPHELSGGERQRVGVARALGGDPPVLLMDEPFGAVDPVTRKHLQDEFRALQASLGKTVIFVTHDIQEAVTLGTRIAVLRRGGILEHFGTPAEVLSRPATRFVAEFVGGEGGLERLSVTHVALSDLTRVPLVANTTLLAEADQLMDESRSRCAIVLDGADRAVGWLARNDDDHPRNSPPDGRVGDEVRPLEATIALGSSFKDALATMLRSDGGFAVVSDSERYVGVLRLDDLHAAMRRAAGGMPIEV